MVIMNNKIIMFISALLIILLVITGCNGVITNNESLIANRSMIAGSFDNSFHIVVNDNGTISIYGQPDKSYNFDGWNDVKNISVGIKNVGAVKNDGSVLITGDQKSGIYAASEWKDIVMLKFTMNAVFGLKRDGTVLCAGEDQKPAPQK